MSAKGGPVFSFSLPGGRGSNPRPPVSYATDLVLFSDYLWQFLYLILLTGMLQACSILHVLVMNQIFNDLVCMNAVLCVIYIMCRLFFCFLY